MHGLKALPALAVLLLVPGEGTAQPNVYVCTPAAQVVAVDATTKVATLIYTGAGSFSDCALGPDGRLYVANGNQVLRFNPQDALGTDETVATLSSAARGLSFNVTTLYVSTVGSGLWALPGISETLGPTFPSPVAAFALPGAGGGTTFAIDGPLWLVSGATVRQSLPPYTTSASLATTGLTTPIGVGANTCGNLLVADQTSQSIRRYSNSGVFQSTYLNFGLVNALKKYFPRHFEIDASNRTYIVADSSTAGKDSLIVRAGPALAGVDPTSSCASTSQVEILAQLDTQAIPGLISNRAVGIAVGPTHHQITKPFSPNDCTKLYNFGYHTLKLTFAECLTQFSVTLSALKSKPSEVAFANDILQFPTTPIEGMRYSPLGGFVIQYRYEAPLAQAGIDFADTVPAFQAKYGFFTQEAVATPGVGRAPGDGFTDPFTQSVGHDYWDIGALDASAGERENDFSKRVVFNSGLAQTCTFGGFQEPLQTGHPLFNSPQNIKIAFKLLGAGCAGGKLRVSVARLEANDFVVQDVRSGQQLDNVMDSSGPGNYHYNLETIDYTSGTYRITIWGNLISPINKDIVIQN